MHRQVMVGLGMVVGMVVRQVSSWFDKAVRHGLARLGMVVRHGGPEFVQNGGAELVVRYGLAWWFNMVRHGDSAWFSMVQQGGTA